MTPHPPRAYFAGAEPPLELVESDAVAGYVVVVALVLAAWLALFFAIAALSSDPPAPAPAPTVATEMPREVVPLHQAPPATQAPAG